MSLALLLTAAVLAQAEDPAPPHWSFAAMPTFNYSSDTGFGFGARGKAQRVANGVTPYWMSIEAQLYGSTGGTQMHFLSIDLPSIAGSGWRVEALGGFRRNVAAHYYGLGDHPPVSEEHDDVYVETAPLMRLRARRALAGHLSLQLGWAPRVLRAHRRWRRISPEARGAVRRERRGVLRAGRGPGVRHPG